MADVTTAGAVEDAGDAAEVELPLLALAAAAVMDGCFMSTASAASADARLRSWLLSWRLPKRSDWNEKKGRKRRI